MRARHHLVVALGLTTACSTTSPGPTVAHARARRFVNTGDPLPAQAGPHDPGCPGGGNGLRWVDSDPHTPFLVTDQGGIHQAGRACCAEWAAPRTTWHAVDAYGQVSGTAELTSGDGYDVTQCYELGFTLREGGAGVGLFAEGKLAPPPSAEWRPSTEERAALERFAAALEPLLGDQPIYDDHGSVAPLYFQIARGSSDGSRVASEHYAVFGGRALVVARIDAAARVSLAHLVRMPAEGYAPVERPIAVFDLDGDGIPEIIAHWNAGDSWSDYVLKLDDRGRGFDQVAESVGGSTA